MSDHILNFKPVRSVWDALAMRSIRNECRSYMTQNTSRIGILKQLMWFFTTYRQWLEHETADAWIGWYKVGDYYDVPVAYGLIRGLKAEPVLSGGIRKKYRGKGFGKQLFEFLTHEASHVNKKGESEHEHRAVFLEVLESNFRAQGLYKKLGFKETHRKHGIIYMKKSA